MGWRDDGVRAWEEERTSRKMDKKKKKMMEAKGEGLFADHKREGRRVCVLNHLYREKGGDWGMLEWVVRLKSPFCLCHDF